jgi:Protein of unknown function (DUF3606)
LRDWSTHFGCTHEQLKQAVGAVGPMTKDVLAYLRRQGWTHR